MNGNGDGTGIIIGIDIGFAVIGGIICSIFQASFVAGIVIVSILGFLIVSFAIMVVLALVLDHKYAIKNRNAATEEKISSDEYKASVKKMLSKAIVEIQYPDMKPVDLEDTNCLQVIV